jgi:hypothetical protein
MASTLYHELLHVWFIHARQGVPLPTGHGDLGKDPDQVDPEFFEGIKAFMGELDELEQKLHAEAEAERQRVVQTPSPTPDVSEPAVTPAQKPPTSRWIGGELSIQGGGGSTGAGIVGADLVLGEIWSLRLGARGIYLTPNHLLVGGTLGVRALQTEERGAFGPSAPIERPLFFDIEAGLLRELDSTDSERLTNKLAVYGSAGFGREYGTRGARFFWRAGGFVIISDQDKKVSAGGTLGVGGRF